jgi:hypothetical protein
MPLARLSSESEKNKLSKSGAVGSSGVASAYTSWLQPVQVRATLRCRAGEHEATVQIVRHDRSSRTIWTVLPLPVSLEGRRMAAAALPSGAAARQGSGRLPALASELSPGLSEQFVHAGRCTGPGCSRVASRTAARAARANPAILL